MCLLISYYHLGTRLVPVSFPSEPPEPSARTKWDEKEGNARITRLSVIGARLES